jgi:ABC-type nitrate/sulfonate/bicarbonate transport system substrate-binding protein
VTIGIPAASASALVQYVGADQGLYERHGFAVQIQQLRSNLAPAALMSKQIQYFAGVDSTMRAAIAGMPVKVVSVTRKAPTFGVVARAGVERVPDLRGKVVGTTAATGSTIYGLKRLLEAHGMALGDVQVLAGGDAPVALQNLLQGLTDAAVLAAPQVFVAQDQGFAMLAYMPDHVQFASNGLAVSDEALQERRDEIQRMIATDIAIVEFIQQNREQAIATLVNRLGVSPEQAARTYDFEVPAYTTDPRLNRADVEASILEELEGSHISALVSPDQAVAFAVAEPVAARAR